MQDPKPILGFILLAVLGALGLQTTPASGQTSALTYQGRLVCTTNLANGSYDLQFSLYDAFSYGSVVGGPITNSGINVSNGLFIVTLDFGASVFSGADRWLEVAVRTNGDPAGFQILSPRQPITAAPYAVRAATVTTVSGTIKSSNIDYATLDPTNLNNSAFLQVLIGQEGGMSYGNFNQFSWQNTYRKIRSGKPFTIMRVADGLGGVIVNGMLANASYRLLTNRFPLVGYANSSGIQAEWRFGVSGPASVAGPQDATYYKLYGSITAAGGTVTYTNNSGGALADTFNVITLQNGGLGHFQVQTQVNGGTWTTVSGLDNVSAAGPGPKAVVTSFTSGGAAPAPTNIRVVSTDGAVVVLDAGAINSTAGLGLIIGDWYGVASASMAQMNMQGGTDVSAAWQTWNPDLILFEKIGIDDRNGSGPCNLNYSCTNFAAFWNFIRTNTPNADVVMCGIYPVTTNNTGCNADNEIITNNLTQLQVCQSNGWAYFDGHTPFVDSQTMQNRFWQASDGVHLTASGYQAYDALLVHWLSFETAGPFSQGSLDLPANAPSAWPTHASTPGGASFVNSNGTVYILTSTPGSTVWNATNKLAGP